jgi:Ca2+-binding RTX toxin-like protein
MGKSALARAAWLHRSLAALLAACHGPPTAVPPTAGWAYPGIEETSRPLLPLQNPCTFQATSGLMAVTVQGGEVALVGRATDGAMTVNGVACDAARSTSVRRIDIVEDAGAAGDQTVIIDYSNGLFALGTSNPAGSAIHVNLGSGSDDLKLLGSASADTITLGALGIAVNTDAFPDIVVANLSSLRYTVSTGAGSDRIIGAGGNGTGNPFPVGFSAYGGADNDLLIGGSGDDSLFGGPGNDSLAGALGDDILDGEEGNDTLDGESAKNGNDTYLGGDGTDLMDYSKRTAPLVVVMDQSRSGVGTDSGEAGEADRVGDDVENLYGGGGSDTITGNALANRLEGRAGNDTFLETSDTSTDIFVGGGGGAADTGTADTVDYSARTNSLVLKLSGIAESGEPSEKDTVSADIEVLIGGRGNDTITGSARGDRLNGGAGDDVLRGGDGDDVLIGGEGNDTLYGENGDDTFLATNDTSSDGNDVINCGPGSNDALDYSVRTVPVTVDLAAGGDSTGMAGENDTVAGAADDCEVAVGGSEGGNSLFGNTLDNILDGYAATSTAIDGRGGVDTCLNAEAATHCEL